MHILKPTRQRPWRLSSVVAGVGAPAQGLEPCSLCRFRPGLSVGVSPAGNLRILRSAMPIQRRRTVLPGPRDPGRSSLPEDPQPVGPAGYRPGMAKDETTVEIDGEAVRVSSPGRVVFPERGWTKMDVIEHFLLCAEGAARGIQGRPTMLKRYMKGVGEPPVYHKRAAKNTPFDTVDMRFPSQRPGVMNVPRTQADVIRLAQLGCLDFHPWPVRAEDIDHPDELRIDLDPTPGFDFEDVRKAAAATKELLDELGMLGWPKTSGSRGIHVYVRLEPIWDFFQVRRAVLALARELERREPELITTAWWKEERNGIFIDFNQMAQDKTVSSAYGVRPTGFVSTPFTWDELADVHLEDFPMKGGFEDRYRRVGDLTAAIDATTSRIDTLLEWVVRDDANGQGDAPWPPHYPKQPGEPPRVQPSKQRRPDEEY